tara:strand:- start:4557 stop:5729 length:1173 start_codon:yes stop_codon:yes gene_type:complete
MPVKIKQIKKGGNISKDSLGDVSSLLDKMFGNNPILDPDIIFTRCDDIKKNMIKLKQIIEIFYKHPMIKDICTDNTHLTKDYNDINIFINELNDFINNEMVFEYTLDDMRKKNITLNDIMHEKAYDDEKAKLLTDYYKKIKSSDFINVAIELLKNMQPHKKYISDDDVNECKWLETLPGHTYEIFPFSSLNIKFVYTIDFNDNNDTYCKKKFIANLLNKIYKCCVNTHNLITDVDFDISKFTDIILNNIDLLKKELPRCDDAFDVISQALHKIKSNFKYYYKDFETTSDPTIIIQNFIKDIYDDNKSNPVVISQLKKIISHFSNKIKSNTKVSPQVSNLIDNLNDLSFKSETSNNNASPVDILNTIKTINYDIINNGESTEITEEKTSND